MSHEWINIILLSFLGFLLLTEKKYKGRVWLKAFTLILPALEAVLLTLPMFFPGEFSIFETFNFFALRRSLLYIFTFALVWEIFHKDFGLKLNWFWPTFAVLFLTGVFTQIQIHYFLLPFTNFIGGELGTYIQRNVIYLLPRIALYLPLAFMVREAFKRKNFILIALCAMAMGELVSDALKAVSDLESIYLMQIRVDNIWPTLFCLMVLYDILKVPAMALLNKTAEGLKTQNQANSYIVVDSLGGTSTTPGQGNLNNLKSILQMDHQELSRNAEEIANAGDWINSVVHESRFEGQHLLNNLEMREYLEFYGVEDTETFLRINSIDTHIMNEIPGGVFVKKADIEAALGIQPEE